MSPSSASPAVFPACDARFADTDRRIADTAWAFLTTFSDAVVPCEVPVELPDPAPCWSALRGTDADAQIGAGPRAALMSAVDDLFAEYDVLATPTTPNPPHGHQGPGDVMSVALTWAFNITGHPAISIPAGRTGTG